MAAMHFRVPWLCLLALLIRTVFGVYNGPKIDCYSACEETLDMEMFTGDVPDTAMARRGGPAPYWINHCQNSLRMQSIWLCTKIYCSPEEFRAGVDYLQYYCEANLAPMLDVSIISNYTQADIDKVRRINLTEAVDMTNYIDEVVVPSKDVFLQTYVAWDIQEGGFRLHSVYAMAMVWYWVGIIAAGLLFRASHLVRRGFRFSSSDLEQRTTEKFTFRLNALNRLFTRLSLFAPNPDSHLHTQFIVPPFFEALAIASFLIINIVICSVRYRVYDDVIFGTSKSMELWTQVADRTGIISTANIPLIWILATRNSILAWLTGWSFATLSSFHRWVAFVATMEAIVHSVAYTVYYVKSGSYHSSFSEQYWYCGVIATIIMSLLLGTSISFLRRRWYETFLILHIAFSLIFIVGMYYHVNVYTDGRWFGWLWAAVAVWALDRTARIVRIVWLNTAQPSSTNMVAVYEEGADIITLRVPVSRFHKPRHGTYYYLYFLNRYKFWESHPFTLSTWQDQNNHSSSHDDFPKTPLEEAKPAGSTEKKQVLVGETASAQSSISTDVSYQALSHGSTLSFVFRPYNGATNWLKHGLMSAQGSSKLRILLEGPYGTSHDLSTSSSLLFIIGGSGISVALSYLCGILKGTLRTTPHGQRQSIHLVWATRQKQLFETIFRGDLGAFLAQSKSPRAAERGVPHLHVSIYLTSSQARQVASAVGPGIDIEHPTVEDISAKIGDPQWSNVGEEDRIAQHLGRPNIESVVLDAARESVGKLQVVSCGPRSMGVEARAAVFKALKGKNAGPIEFIGESFEW